MAESESMDAKPVEEVNQDHQQEPASEPGQHELTESVVNPGNGDADADADTANVRDANMNGDAHTTAEAGKAASDISKANTNTNTIANSNGDANASANPVTKPEQNETDVDERPVDQPPADTLSPKGKRLPNVPDSRPTSEPATNGIYGHENAKAERESNDAEKPRNRTFAGEASADSLRRLQLELEQVRIELRLLSDRNAVLNTENAKLRSKLVDNIKRRPYAAPASTLAVSTSDAYSRISPRRTVTDTYRSVSPLRALHNFDYLKSSARDDYGIGVVSGDSSRSISCASSVDENDVTLMHNTGTSQLYSRAMMLHGGSSLRDLTGSSNAYLKSRVMNSSPARHHKSYTTNVRHSDLYSTLPLATTSRYTEAYEHELERERERERERQAISSRLERDRMTPSSAYRGRDSSWSSSRSVTRSDGFARSAVSERDRSGVTSWRRRPFAPSHHSEVRVGDDVKFTHRGAIGRARVLFVGHVVGEERVLVGLEVHDECALSVCNSDGLLHGVRYFRTRPNRALFLPIDNILLVL